MVDLPPDYLMKLTVQEVDCTIMHIKIKHAVVYDYICSKKKVTLIIHITL